ncbi:MAG: efflux RND transporter periplasmic adaptor subunit [Planctomycetota bacterium]
MRPSSADWSRWKPKLSSRLHFWPVRFGGNAVVRIEKIDTGTFYEVGYAEYVFLTLLDGSRSLTEACGQCARVIGDHALHLDAAKNLVVWAAKQDLVQLDFQGELSAKETADWKLTLTQSLTGYGPTGRVNEKRKWHPLFFQIPIAGANRVIGWIADRLTWMAHPLSIAIACLVIFVTGVVAAGHLDALLRDPWQLVSPSHWTSLLIVWLSLKLIHELAHAAACRRHECRIGDCGIAFMLFAPLAFIDVTATWRLMRRRDRMLVAGAGMLAEVLIACLAFWIWLGTNDIATQTMMRHLMLTAGVSTIVFNGNFLMRLDGYYLLTDLAGVPNLASKGRAEMNRVLAALCFGPPVPYRRPPRLRPGLLAYGLAAAAWRCFFLTSLTFAAWHAVGIGGLIASIAILLTWQAPALRSGLESLSRTARLEPPRFYRAVFVSAAIMLTFWFCFSELRVGHRVLVPAVVQYRPDTAIRASHDGWVQSVAPELETRAASVQNGQTLIKLSDPELDQSHTENTLELKQNALRLQRAIDRRDNQERSKAMATQSKLLAEQVRIEARRERLDVRSPQTANLITEHDDDLIGTFVRRGDTIANVATDSDVELIAYLPQSLESMLSQLQGRRVTAYTPSGRAFSARVDTIEPNASNRLDHASLASDQGGPVPVLLNAEGQRKLLEPHFRVRLSLADQSVDLPTGFRLKVNMGRHRHTIYEWASLWFSEILQPANPAETEH